MKNILFLGLTIVIDGDHLKTEIDLGALTLSRQDRQYILDPNQSYRNFDNGQTTIEVEFEKEIDTDTFPDCKFDLEAIDVLADDLKAEFYFRCEEAWESATLFVQYGGMTKAIDVKLEE